MTEASSLNLIDRERPAGCGPKLQNHSEDSLPMRQQVLEQVRSDGQLPRVDLARALRVSPATVTSVVSELLQDGLLIEVIDTPQERSGGRGRPPVALRVNPKAAYVVGIKISDAAHSGVLLDFAGAQVAEATLPRALKKLAAADLLAEVERVFELLLSDAGLRRTQVSALGLGLPGAIKHDSGVVLWSPLLEETDFDFAKAAIERFEVPVEIDNDANLVTLAELWYGAGRDLSDFAVVTIEHGVGMGFVVGNRLYRGAHGLGLELGHIKVQLDGALCRCGQRGCLEAYVADYALVREARVALNLPGEISTSTGVLLEHLFEQAKAGNEAARSIFRRAGRYLAIGLANVSNLFDPSLIILSGERMQYDYLHNDEVLAEMRRQTLYANRAPQKVQINAWGGQIWACGAAVLAMGHVTQAMAAPTARAAG